MLIVDSHVHASPYWFEPVEVIIFQMNLNRVDKAVLTQFKGQTDNRYLIECTHRFPGRFSPVVIVDPQLPQAPEILKNWVSEGATGLRLTPLSRSPGKVPLAIWHACAKLGLPVTSLGKEEEFASDEFGQVIKALPDLPVIIEHLGHAKRDEPPPYTTFRKILALAKYPNAYIKVGGLGEICERPAPFHTPLDKIENIPPFIRMVYETFGPKRMMWASDYPPSGMREGYGNTLHYLSEYLATFCKEEEIEWILGKTALTVFRFSG